MNCDKDSTVEKGVNSEQRRISCLVSLEETEEGMPTLQHKRRYRMGTSSRHRAARSQGVPREQCRDF